MAKEFLNQEGAAETRSGDFGAHYQNAQLSDFAIQVPVFDRVAGVRAGISLATSENILY